VKTLDLRMSGGFVLLLGATWFLAALLAVEAAEPVNPSDLMPADDLCAQVHEYVEKVGESLAGAENFEREAEAVAKHASVLSVLTAALTRYDRPHPLTKQSALLFESARQMAEAGDHADAKSALDAITAALASNGQDDIAAVEGPVAEMAPVMAESQVLYNQLKRHMLRFDKRRAEGNAQSATVLMAFAEEWASNTDYVADEADEARWRGWCDQLKDSAGQLRASIVADDKATAATAVARVLQSCDDCHMSFRD